MEHSTKITTMSARGFAEMLRSVNLLGSDSKAGFIFAEREGVVVQQEEFGSSNVVTAVTVTEFGKKIKSMLTKGQDFSIDDKLVAVIKEENLQIIANCGINVANKPSKRIKFN